MGNLKITADRIFDGFRFRENLPTGQAGAVLIADEQGKIIDLTSITDAGDDIMRVEGILCPGLINCHGHLELSHMKGFTPEGTGLVKFVLDVVQQRHFPEEQILLAIEKAEDEMLKTGIVAMGDICNNTLTVPQKLKGRIYYHNFIEASGFHPAIAEQRFQRSLDFFREYGKYYSIPIESNSIVPHAPYSVVDELWDKIIGFPGNHLFTIHNQETVGENEWFMNKTGELGELYEKLNIDHTFFKPTGKTSLQSFLPRFLPNQTVILVHNVHTSEEDILLANKSGFKVYWCLCPNANQYISGTMPPVDLFMKNECKIVLGTDSLASNHQLDLLAEIRTIRKHFPSIGIENFLQWATSNGAKALDMDNQLGSFEKGKTPGIIVIEKDLSKARRIV